MQSERKEISPRLYYIFISGLTSLILILVGWAAIDLFSELVIDKVALIIIAVILLWKGGIVAFVTWRFIKYGQDKQFAVKFIGRYLGSFYGLGIGCFFGARIGNLLGGMEAIVFLSGALFLYIVGRRIGPKISQTIGGVIEKVVSVKITQEPVVVMGTKSPKWQFYLFFIVGFPLFFVVVSLMINYFDIPVGYLPELLSFTRIIAIALSIISLMYPWLTQRNGSLKINITSFPESGKTLIGLGLSFVPALYGFVLFIAMGASIVEVCLFALASSISALVWGRFYLIQTVKSG